MVFWDVAFYPSVEGSGVLYNGFLDLYISLAEKILKYEVNNSKSLQEVPETDQIH